jgi:hypothetical protein
MSHVLEALLYLRNIDMLPPSFFTLSRRLLVLLWCFYYRRHLCWWCAEEGLWDELLPKKFSQVRMTKQKPGFDSVYD